MSNYPPGMRESDIPGIDDEDRNYTATLTLAGRGTSLTEAIDYIKLITDGFKINIDTETFVISNKKFLITFDLYGVIPVGPHDDIDEIEMRIKEELPLECKVEGIEIE